MNIDLEIIILINKNYVYSTNIIYLILVDFFSIL